MGTAHDGTGRLLEHLAHEVVRGIGDGDLGQGRGPRMTLDQMREVGAFRQFDRAIFEQQGSGLGLVLVKGIVEASGRVFDLRSRLGEGTTVSASWPPKRLPA